MFGKSIIIAYVLWLVGGLFGLHHFYLRRYFQGIVWSLTLGGFGIGWIYDFFQIPGFVKYSNHQQNYMERLEKWGSLKKPSFSFSRLFLSFYISFLISLLIYSTFSIYFDQHKYGGLIIIITVSLG